MLYRFPIVSAGPCGPPPAPAGSFEVVDHDDNTKRSLVVYWSRLPAQCENGPQAGYTVTVLDTQNLTMFVVQAILFSTAS